MSVAFAVLCRPPHFPVVYPELIAANRLAVETCRSRSKVEVGEAGRGSADGPGGGA
jgi:hypothetical protein